jgi:hypothetical protein
MGMKSQMRALVKTGVRHLSYTNIKEVSVMNINLTSENIFAKINIDESKGGAYEWRN